MKEKRLSIKISLLKTFSLLGFLIFFFITTKAFSSSTLQSDLKEALGELEKSKKKLNHLKNLDEDFTDVETFIKRACPINREAEKAIQKKDKPKMKKHCILYDKSFKDDFIKKIERYLKKNYPKQSIKIVDKHIDYELYYNEEQVNFFILVKENKNHPEAAIESQINNDDQEYHRIELFINEKCKPYSESLYFYEESPACNISLEDQSQDFIKKLKRYLNDSKKWVPNLKETLPNESSYTNLEIGYYVQVKLQASPRQAAAKPSESSLKIKQFIDEHCGLVEKKGKKTEYKKNRRNEIIKQCVISTKSKPKDLIQKLRNYLSHHHGWNLEYEQDLYEVYYNPSAPSFINHTIILSKKDFPLSPEEDFTDVETFIKKSCKRYSETITYTKERKLCSLGIKEKSFIEKLNRYLKQSPKWIKQIDPHSNRSLYFNLETAYELFFVLLEAEANQAPQESQAPQELSEANLYKCLISNYSLSAIREINDQLHERFDSEIQSEKENESRKLIENYRNNKYLAYGCEINGEKEEIKKRFKHLLKRQGDEFYFIQKYNKKNAFLVYVFRRSDQILKNTRIKLEGENKIQVAIPELMDYKKEIKETQYIIDHLKSYWKIFLSGNLNQEDIKYFFPESFEENKEYEISYSYQGKEIFNLSFKDYQEAKKVYKKHYQGDYAINFRLYWILIENLYFRQS